MVGSLFKADFVLQNPFKLSSERPIDICISLEKLSVGNFSSYVSSLHFYIHCVPFANNTISISSEWSLIVINGKTVISLARRQMIARK